MRGFLVTTFAIIGGFCAPPVIAGPPKGDTDYPPDAKAKHQQGTVLVDLIIGRNGRVTGCSVLVSSSSSALDDETCKQFFVNARFKAATVSRGTPVRSHGRGKITWVLPGCPMPEQSDPRLQEPVSAHVMIKAMEGC